MSKFEEGGKVVCISDDFPHIKKYGGIVPPSDLKKPKLGEILIVDDVLGEFLRFDEYDTEASNHWWKDDRFLPIDEYEKIEKEMFSDKKHVELISVN